MDDVRRFDQPMSVRVWSAVWRLDLGTSTKLVLLALANYANDDGGNARPGLDRLAQDTGLSRRAVQYRLRHLEGLGLIEPVAAQGGGRGHRSTYRVVMEKGAEIAPIRQERVHPVAPFTPKKGAIRDTERVQSATGKGASSDMSSREPLRREGTVIEPSLTENGVNPPVVPPSPKGGHPPRAKTTLPDDFAVTEAMRRRAEGYGVPPDKVDFETELFRNWAEGGGERKVDWGKTWLNWLARSVRISGYDRPHGRARASPNGYQDRSTRAAAELDSILAIARGPAERDP